MFLAIAIIPVDEIGIIIVTIIFKCPKEINPKTNTPLTNTSPISFYPLVKSSDINHEGKQLAMY